MRGVRKRSCSSIMILFTLVILVIFLQSCSRFTYFHITENKSEKAFIDLNLWSFEKDGPIRMIGDTWELYWNKLYTPEAFNGGGIDPTAAALIEPVLVDGGTAWNGLKVNGRILTADGFGTYRTVIEMPEAGRVYTFYMTNQDSAYRMWINGELTAENGLVAVSPDDYTPQRLPKLFHYYADSTDLEIVIQISNYTHKWGGLTNNIYLGLPFQIQKFVVRLYSVTIFICGAIFIMAVYHLFLFINRKKDFSSLIFSLFSFSVFFWYLYSQDYLIFQAFPNLPMSLGIRIFSFMLFLASPLFVMFINSVFSGNLKRFTVLGVYIASAILLLSTVFTPISFFTSVMMKVFYGITILNSTLVILILIRAIMAGSAGAKLSLIGFLIFFGSTIYDILSNLKFIIGSPFGPYMPSSLFIFILFQSFILAIRFSGAFTRLDEMSRNLEVIVKERTIQLAKAQREISEREKLAAIGTMVGGISHEIMNPLSGITGPVSIIKKEIENSSIDNKALMQKHLNYIESNSAEISMTIKNLNALVKDKNIIKKPILLATVIEKVFSTFELPEEDVSFEYSNENGEIINADEGILFQILSNLVSNALHSVTDHGRIKITHKLDRSGLTQLIVEDDGCGMDADVKAKASDAFFTSRETEGGTGLGLFLVNRLADSLGWTVEIDSEPGHGTIVRLNLN